MGNPLPSKGIYLIIRIIYFLSFLEVYKKKTLYQNLSKCKLHLLYFHLRVLSLTPYIQEEM